MKPARKLVEVVEEISKIKAGIIGEGKVAELLSDKLREKNCDVILSPIYDYRFGNCKYIFQLTDFGNFDKVVRICRQKEIKLVAVSSTKTKKYESYLEKAILSQEKRGLDGRLIKVGETAIWDEEQLVRSCLWAMFAAKERILNFAKEGLTRSVSSQKVKVNPRVKAKLPRWAKLSLFFLILFSPLLVLIFNFYLLYKNLSALEVNMKQNKWDEAKRAVLWADRDISINKGMLSVAETLFSPFNLSLVSDWQKLTDISEKSLSIEKMAIEGREIFILEKKQSLSSGGKVDKNGLVRVANIVQNMAGDLGKIQSDIGAVNWPFFPKEKIRDKTNKLRSKLSFIQSLMPLASGIAGDEKNKTYLILFQNNTELRPTGGFIGSYGLMTVKSGSMGSLSIHDVYEADGQLKAHVDPPMAFRDYMSQPNWFLRDSNFDPDFALSAQQAEWFLEKETGERVDGVMGMNLYFLRDLLDSVGSIYLPDYKENITADNLIIKATVYSQQGFFPGSTAKRNFLGSLANGLLFSLTDSDRVDWAKLADRVSSSLDEKNLLFYFHDTGLQKLVEEKGWGGRIVDISCPTDNCFGDYLAIIEANLGVNKANLYLTKQISLKKSIDEGGMVSAELSIDYQNNSPEEAFPSGGYKNFLRVYLPRDATVLSVLADGVKVDQVLVKSYGNDKEEVGFLVEIPAQGKKNIVISFNLPLKISLSDKVYQFFYEKQPGDATANLNLQVNFPSTWMVTPHNFIPNKNQQGFQYTTDTAVDRVFIFDVGRQ